ncbi:ankyrin repeat-containing protein ITN1-like [Syzygium oleosum]|uniref:ankyrin repeat-containing protein ITN1-like n=1 Tax=Syzygium oleosum TaxID=219896 RepID=UPI0024B9F91E|nr:ankyrin repeat-containing protein ITN1-like [Syzygium oleosum]
MSSQSSSQQASLASERRHRERRLYEASLAGCVESLAHLLQEDRLILARTSVTCFDETPLHLACMLGHVHFAKALLAHKQDLTMELDSQGRTPLHLASANGYVEIARELSQSDPVACLVLDEDGRTPLHLAVMKGRSDVVRELVKARPEAAICRLSHGQTVLHLGARHNRLETLKVLVEMVRDGDLLNAQDDEGNTILHLATANKQIETMKYLLQRSEVEVNTVNRNGFTALDIVDHFPRDLKVMELRELLVHAGAVRATIFPASTTHQAVDGTDEKNSTVDIELASLALPSANTPPVKAVLARSLTGEIRKQKEDTHEKWIKKKRDSLMIAATVIAAMAYQAGLSPPGGVWDEDKNIGGVTYWAGTSIMAANNPYGYQKFWTYNTVSLVASLSTVFLLVSGLPLKKKILVWILMATSWATITFMALTYLESMRAISFLQDRHPEELRPIIKVVGNAMYVWLGVLSGVLLVHTVRFLRIVLRIVKNPQELKEKISGFLSRCRSRTFYKI